MRQFEAIQAKRERVPLLVGLFGPSGSGKTFSALRLATGIVSRTGGQIYVIDTEARRSLHYADSFTFQHVGFGAPFGSLDYLDAIRQCGKAGAGCIIIDSMSHEHEGDGGYLQTHEREVERLAGDDYAKRERVKMLAWSKPAAQRQALINGILQLNTNLIFCFRAKEKTKPVAKNGKTEVVELGFMPICGEALLFEMTASMLLLPRANGIPTWDSDNIGEKLTMKLPEQFKPLLSNVGQLSENVGKAMADWARGAIAPDGPPKLPAIAPQHEATARALEAAAEMGVESLKTTWAQCDHAERDALKPHLDAVWKPRAATVGA